VTAPAPHHVAVLAGGKGTRFWPVGRASRPKQVLPLDGDDPRPLVRATYDRAVPLCDADGPWVVASKILGPTLTRLLPARARRRFLLEPQPKNTAAALAWTAIEVGRAIGGAARAAVAVVPSDHHVAPEGAWRLALRGMLDRAAATGRIVTLGLRPTFPATGYGYLEVGEARAVAAGGEVRAVTRFVEKPPRPAANRYVKSGRFLWNLGTFAFRPEAFLAAMDLAFPEGAAAFATLRAARRRAPAQVAAAYRAVPSISVDYAVMERAKDLEVLAASFDWDDLGSWDAVARHATPDGAGNVAPEGTVAVDATDCFVRAEDGTTVALLGVNDLVVVRTKDALLVARRGRGEDVRKIHDELLRRGRDGLVS
jgi:mannose-1-phosphate guanylyltransferase/mannose-6-phosphate isomerase